MDLFPVKLLNIQGLTNVKYAELEGEIGEGTILCLTETQKKINDIKMSERIRSIESMSSLTDRRGGGLLVLYREGGKVELEREGSRSKDILEVSGKIGGVKVKIVLVYLATGQGGAAEINEGIMEEIREKIGRAEERGEGVVLLGDFNGHLGYLGHQEESITGAIVNRMIEQCGLNLLNIDERCVGGTYT